MKASLCFLLLLMMLGFGTNATGTSNAYSSAWKEQATRLWEAWCRWFDLHDLLRPLSDLIRGPHTGSTGGGGPILAPDLSECHPAEPNNQSCCIPLPPSSSTIHDFNLPPPSFPLRVRRPAHAADPEYIAKYSKAVALMKALPDDDPRSFTNQARIHCAYCSYAYALPGYPGLDLQVHFTWLFFPWHRWFLYFHERILGSLIGDPTFVLPFWNWDSPDGMSIPLIYAANSSSPLFDVLRDSNHQPSTAGRLIYFNFFGGDPPNITTEEQIDVNLKILYRQMVSNSKTTSLFLGTPQRVGDLPRAAAGSLEIVPHAVVHVWTGDPKHNHYNMGFLGSSALDPIFYAHHGNIDRLWDVWRSKLGGKNYDDGDWLESEFLFYDHDGRLVRVKIKDCLDAEMMGYTYQEVDVPWLTSRPTPSMKGSGGVTTAEMAVEFPVTLREAVSVNVKRERGRNGEEEVLVVEGIEVEMGVYVKFDVYVNAPAKVEMVTPAASEFAGSFVSLPHRHRSESESRMKRSLRLGISELLEDLEAEGADSIVVTLVPVSGKGDVKVGGVSIEFEKL